MESALVGQTESGQFSCDSKAIRLVPMKTDCSDIMVCVVDDEAAVRRSLERLLRSAGLRARVFASAAEYLAQAPPECPCCLILDVNMPDLDGFALLGEINGRTEKIVFLTGHGDIPMCARALKAGAVDFLTKPVDDSALLDAVHRALTASRAALADGSERDEARARLATLTPREQTVLRGVVSGMLNKQIAAELGIAEKTIKVHRGRMMRKVGVVSVADLVRLTIAAGYQTRNGDRNPHS